MLPPFGWQSVLTQWQAPPAVVALLLIAAGAYLWGVARVARRHPARPWPASRTALFLSGLAVVAIALCSGLGTYDDVVFADHMIQHLLLVMAAPPLLIFGQPITLLLHASRNPLHTWVKRAVRSRAAGFLTWPPFGFAAYAAAIVVLHLTAVANLTATNQAAHDAEHLIFLAVGYLFFLPVVGTEPIRWRLSYPARLGLLFLVMPVDTFTGLLLGYGSKGTPGVPAGPRPPWAGSAVADLHAGGAVMWVAGDGLMFALMMVVFWMWSTDSRGQVRRRGWLEAARREAVAPGTAAGSGDIDEDDSQLAAYNEYLSRLGNAEAGRHPR